MRSTPPCVSPSDEEARWFKEEVQPHETGLRQWLRARFPTINDLDDLIHDAYARLFRARRSGKVKRAKNYLFSIARNAALDTVRHDNVIPFIPLEEEAGLPVLQEEPGVTESACRNQELQLLREAISSLPLRCRQAFTSKLCSLRRGVPCGRPRAASSAAPTQHSARPVCRPWLWRRWKAALHLRAGLANCAASIQRAA